MAMKRARRKKVHATKSLRSKGKAAKARKIRRKQRHIKKKIKVRAPKLKARARKKAVARAVVESKIAAGASRDEDELPDYLSESYQDTAPETEAPPAAEAAAQEAAAIPVDTQLVLPATGLYGTHTAARRFGIAQTIEALAEVGRICDGRHARDPIGIGDISKQGGGPISGHASHRRGVDVDIRPLRNDGQELPVTIHDPTYSRQLTQEAIDLVHANSVLAVDKIFFNDSAVQGVQPWPNHDNHFHVRFHLPGVGSAPPLLVKNDRKPAVRELQRRLNHWIASTTTGVEPLDVNGRFDDETLVAVRAFQTAMGLEVDGKVGHDTWGKLPKA
jgi:hypothetical protein